MNKSEHYQTIRESPVFQLCHLRIYYARNGFCITLNFPFDFELAALQSLFIIAYFIIVEQMWKTEIFMLVIVSFSFFFHPLRCWASAVLVHFSAHASLDQLRANVSGFLFQTSYLFLTHGWISSSGLSNESLSVSLQLSLEWRMQHAKGNSYRWFRLAQMLSCLRRPDYQCSLCSLSRK